MDSEDYDEFLCRIAKTLYYGNTASFDSVSLPLAELGVEIYNEVKKENGSERLQMQDVTEICENACVSTCSLVLAILYLEKIKSINPEYVERVAPSELFLVSLLIASKFLNDDGEEGSFSNNDWAACSGLSVKTVNRIEKQFLNAINWEVHIADDLFWSRLLTMERYLARREGKRRGWFSYTELNVLLNADELLEVKKFLKYSTVCFSCYAGAVLTFITSAVAAIRVERVLVNFILCLLIHPTIDERSDTTIRSTTSNTLHVPTFKNLSIDEPSSTTSVSISYSGSSVPVLKNVSIVLNGDEIPAKNNSVEGFCDNSWLVCPHANSTSKFLSLKEKLVTPSFIKLLNHTTLHKPNVVSRNSFFHSWPNW